MRLVSALVLIPIALAAVYAGGLVFLGFVALGAGVMVGEIYLATERRLAWTLAGGAYLLLAAYALIHLRQDASMGITTLAWLFALVWSADTGAYLAGRTFGGPKFAPVLSPKKTWSGFAGAVVSAGLVGAVTALLLGKATVGPLAGVSAALGALSQYGDLLESWVKRRFDRKDMSNLIPGHGGLADRADGLVAAAIGAWLIDLMTTESLLLWL